MISRAVMLATGDGVAENQVEARSWYERAARSGEEGWAHALRGLGGMLVIGEGGPVDLPRGFGYLLAAHAAGDEFAGQLIERFRAQITPEVEGQAVAIAKEWVKAPPTRD
jgi:TPR repeat protein